MGDHVHHKGGLMASYRYMFMSMQQNYDGDSRISDAEVRRRYMVASADMDMQMHMFGVMYAPSDKLTLMLMTNYTESSMLNVNRMGRRALMRTSGWGDTTLAGYYSLYRGRGSSAHVGLGVSAPTGSIDERMANGMRMGYRMQLGSGTWDLKPSLTWLGRSGLWSYGTQLSAVVRLDENDNGYSLGDRASLTGWLNRRLNDWSSASVRLTATGWENVDGRDTRMPAMPNGMPMAGAADPGAQGGTRLDLSLGLNFWSTSSGARFAVEAGAPVYQNLDGPQLGTEWFVTAGLQFSW